MTGFMRAAYMVEPGKLEIKPVEIPKPGAGEVLIRVKGVGVCSTDYGYFSGYEGTMKELYLKRKYRDKLKSGDMTEEQFWEEFGGLVLGHEPSGIIAEVGKGVKNLKEGDKVLGQPVENCEEHYRNDGIQCLNWGCKGARFFGSSEDGAFREFYVAKANQVHKLPEDIDLLYAAPLADAFSTPWRALTERAQIQKGDKVVIYGCGGVGMPAVALANKMGAEVIAVDINPYKLQMAKHFGAVEVYNPNEHERLDKVIKKDTEGGADIALEIIGNPETQANALKLLRPEGWLIIVGYSGKSAQLATSDIMFKDLEIKGSLGCGPTLYDSMIKFVQEKGIDLKEFGTKVIPLEKLADEFDNWGKEDSIRTIVDMDLKE